jgi:hypothetical protein
MPFRSRAQQRMFFARAKDSPKWKKMAKHWQKATGKRKLPSKKAEASEVDEMPHLDLNRNVAGMHFGTIDLNIEKYPGMSSGDRRALMNALNTSGVVAKLRPGLWLIFTPDQDVRQATPQEIEGKMHLPDYWLECLTNLDVPESSAAPKMNTFGLFTLRFVEKLVLEKAADWFMKRFFKKEDDDAKKTVIVQLDPEYSILVRETYEKVKGIEGIVAFRGSDGMPMVYTSRPVVIEDIHDDVHDVASNVIELRRDQERVLTGIDSANTKLDKAVAMMGCLRKDMRND